MIKLKTKRGKILNFIKFTCTGTPSSYFQVTPEGLIASKKQFSYDEMSGHGKILKDYEK